VLALESIKSLIAKYGSILRWASVGMITAVIDYIIFITMYSVVTSVLIANFCSGLLSIIFNYLAHYFWSFRSEVNHLKSGAKFFINLIVIWSLSTLLLNILINEGIEPKFAKLIPMLFVAPLSFISMRFFVYKKKPI
jgi:putative flippase GtrA